MKAKLLYKHLLTAFGIGLFVAYVLIIFQPFGTNTFQHPHKNLFLMGYGVIIFSCYLLVYTIQELVIKPRRVLSGFRFWLSEGLVLLVMIWLSLTISFFYHHWFIGYDLKIQYYLGFILLGSSIALMPIALIITLRYFSKQKQINASIEVHKKGESAIKLTGTNKTDEELTTLPSELVYVMANGNYTEIYKNENNKLTRVILRNSLSNIQDQLPQHLFLKVHRSYVVNTQYFDKVFLEASKYFLKLKTFDAPIPLSRSIITQVRNTCT